MIFDVAGMSCQHCVAAITAAVHGLDSEAVVAVDLDTGMVSVEGTAETAAVCEAIRGAGYDATPRIL